MIRTVQLAARKFTGFITNSAPAKFIVRTWRTNLRIWKLNRRVVKSCRERIDGLEAQRRAWSQAVGEVNMLLGVALGVLINVYVWLWVALIVIVLAIVYLGLDFLFGLGMLIAGVIDVLALVLLAGFVLVAIINVPHWIYQAIVGIRLEGLRTQERTEVTYEYVGQQAA